MAMGICQDALPLVGRTKVRCFSLFLKTHDSLSLVYIYIYMDPPLPSGPAPIISVSDVASLFFNSRSEFFRFLLLPGAFDALVMSGRQPFCVWKGFPD